LYRISFEELWVAAGCSSQADGEDLDRGVEKMLVGEPFRAQVERRQGHVVGVLDALGDLDEAGEVVVVVEDVRDREAEDVIARRDLPEPLQHADGLGSPTVTRSVIGSCISRVPGTYLRMSASGRLIGLATTFSKSVAASASRPRRTRAAPRKKSSLRWRVSPADRLLGRELFGDEAGITEVGNL
jgi:hypothetical protein